MADQTKIKYVPNWNQQLGKVTKTEQGMQIHPHDLISLIQRKKGIDEAGKVAVQFISQKYNKLFEEAKE